MGRLLVAVNIFKEAFKTTALEYAKKLITNAMLPFCSKFVELRITWVEFSGSKTSKRFPINFYAILVRCMYVSESYCPIPPVLKQITDKYSNNFSSALAESVFNTYPKIYYTYLYCKASDQNRKTHSAVFRNCSFPMQ